MTKYLVPAVIVVALIILVACSVAGSNKTSSSSGSAAPSKPSAEGHLVHYTYSYAGGMEAKYYEASVAKESDGTWFYETFSDPRSHLGNRVTYRYALASETLESIEEYLKTNGLWVGVPFAPSEEIIMDGYNYSWSFMTEKQSYIIYHAMTQTDEVAEKLGNLNAFIDGLKDGKKREKLPTAPVYQESDIMGFMVEKQGKEVSIVVNPEQSWIRINHERYEATAMTAAELLDKIKALYLQNEELWGAQILDSYPLELGAGDSNTSNSLYFVVKGDEYSSHPFTYIRKMSESGMTKEVEAFIDGTIQLIEQNTKKQAQ